MAEIWSSSFSISHSNEYSGLISFRTDWFDLLVVQGKSLLQYHNSKASILWHSFFFTVQLTDCLPVWGRHKTQPLQQILLSCKQTPYLTGEGDRKVPHCQDSSKTLLPLEEGRNKSPLPLVRRARRPLGTRILYQDNAEVSCHGQGWLRERTVFFSGTARNTRRSLTAEEGQK